MDHDAGGFDTAVVYATSYDEKKGLHPANKEALKRLTNIEGQIRGIERMVENEKYCVDILTQVSAVRAALNRVGMLILKRHITNCVSDAIKKGGTEGKEIIDELMHTLSKEKI
jgi:DNA-binding FrmR family transcriptional regulator